MHGLCRARPGLCAEGGQASNQLIAQHLAAHAAHPLQALELVGRKPPTDGLSHHPRETGLGPGPASDLFGKDGQKQRLVPVKLGAVVAGLGFAGALLSGASHGENTNPVNEAFPARYRNSTPGMLNRSPRPKMPPLLLARFRCAWKLKNAGASNLPLLGRGNAASRHPIEAHMNRPWPAS